MTTRGRLTSRHTSLVTTRHSASRNLSCVLPSRSENPFRCRHDSSARDPDDGPAQGVPRTQDAARARGRRLPRGPAGRPGGRGDPCGSGRWGHRRARGTGPGGSGRRVLRAAGPQRRRQDHDLEHPHHARGAHVGARGGGRCRRRARSRGCAPAHRGGAAAAESGSQPHGPREPALPRRVFRHRAPGGRGARRPAARSVRPRGPRRRQGQRALGRAAAAR